MSTLSPRVGLTIMSDSDFIDPSVVDGNSTRLDAITSVTQASSTSRPSSPFDGQHIYETDTQNFRRYDKASGKWYLLGSGPNGSAAQGLIGTFSNTNAATLSGTSGGQNFQAVSMLDYSFSVIAGHNYKIIEQGWFSVTGSPAQVIQSSDLVELYTLWQLGSNPGLGSTVALHYSQYWYNKNEWGTRVPFFRTMQYGAGITGTLFLRSCVRTDTSFWTTTTRIGRPADTIGSYAWAYDEGAKGATY